MKSSPLVAFGLLLMACGSPVGPPPSVLDGSWTGAAGIFQFDASLSQDDTRLAGSGAVGPTPGSRADFPTLATDVVGSYHHPDVELSWNPTSGGPPYRFTGQRVTPGRIEGTVTFGSSNTAPLTLQRQ